MGQLIRRLRSCDSGSALVEYGLLLAVLILGLAAAVTLLRKSVEGLTTSVSAGISQPASAGHVPPAPAVAIRPHTGPPGHMPVPADPDGDSDDSEDTSTDPDSSAAEPDGSTAASRLGSWFRR